MSKKLTKEMLDALIQEAMLQEDFGVKGDAETFLKKLNIKGVALKPFQK